MPILKTVTSTGKSILGKIFPSLAKQAPIVGPIVSLAIDLGALDWVVAYLKKALIRIFHLDDATADKVINVSSQVVKVTEESKSTVLKDATKQDKQSFALNTLEGLFVVDGELRSNVKILAAAPLIVQFIYELYKLQQAYKNVNRQTLSTIMILTGLRGLTEPTAKPMDELMSSLKDTKVAPEIPIIE